MLSKLKTISDSYDELFQLVVLIKQRYHDLGRQSFIPEEFSEKNCPEILAEVTPADFSKLEEFKKQVNVYDRAVKLNLLK